MQRKPPAGTPKQAPVLVVLISGAGRRGTSHPFFPECEMALRQRGVYVVKSDVRDEDNYIPIKEKARQTSELAGEHIRRLKPEKVIVIGHSQGYCTGGNAIMGLQKLHPGTKFYLIGVCNPRSRKEHDERFNVFLRIMGRNPINSGLVSKGARMNFKPQYTIHLMDDPLIVSSKRTKMPRRLSDRRALAGGTHFLEDRQVRQEIIGWLKECVQKLRAHDYSNGSAPYKEFLTIG